MNDDEDMQAVYADEDSPIGDDGEVPEQAAPNEVPTKRATEGKFRVSGAMLKSLRDVAEAVKLHEFNVLFRGSEAWVCAADAAHVALIDAKFTVDGAPADPLELLIDVAKFKDAIKPFSGDKDVLVEVKGAQVKLKVGRRHRTMMTLDAKETQRPRLPPLSWPVSFTVPKAWLHACLKASPEGTTIVAVEAKGGEFHYTASNDNRTDVYEDSMAVEGLDGGAAERTLLSLNYLVDLAGPAVSQEIKVSLGTNYPLSLNYAISEGVATVLLAPRVEQDGA